MLLRRWFVRLVALLAVPAILAGCAPDESDTAGEADINPPAETEEPAATPEPSPSAAETDECEAYLAEMSATGQTPNRLYVEARGRYDELAEQIPQLLEEQSALEVERHQTNMNQELRQMGLALLEAGERAAEVVPPPEAAEIHSDIVQVSTRFGSSLLAVADGTMTLSAVGSLGAELAVAWEMLDEVCD